MDSLSRLAPLSGVVAVVLFAVGSAIWALEQPPRDAATEELISFYEDTSIEILIGGTMSIIALLFFVWFGAVLRERLLAAEGSERTGLPLVALAGTVITAAVGLGAETINMAGALRTASSRPTPPRFTSTCPMRSGLLRPGSGSRWSPPPRLWSRCGRAARYDHGPRGPRSPLESRR